MTVAKIKKVQAGIAKVTLMISALMVLSIAVVLFANVLGRYVFRISMMWVELYARYMLIWSVFVCANVLIERNELMRVDFLDSLWPKKFLKIREIFYTVIFLIILFILIVEGFHQATDYIGVIAQGLPITKFWVYLCVPVGALLMLVQYLLNLLCTLLSWKEGREN